MLDQQLCLFIFIQIQIPIHVSFKLKRGIKKEDARFVLPNACCSEIQITANFREWRTIFKQRLSPAAHPQMIALMKLLIVQVKKQLPASDKHRQDGLGVFYFATA